MPRPDEFAERPREVFAVSCFDFQDQFQRRWPKCGDFPEARKPAFKLWIDFGAGLGIKRSSVQITVHYKLDQLIGRQILAVVNFPPRQIGPFVSEVLTLGVPDDDGAVVLLKPDFKVADGGRMF